MIRISKKYQYGFADHAGAWRTRLEAATGCLPWRRCSTPFGEAGQPVTQNSNSPRGKGVSARPGTQLLSGRVSKWIISA